MIPEKKFPIKVFLFSVFLLWGMPTAGSFAETCYTKCVGMVQLECGTNKVVGACVGAWGCPSGDNVMDISKAGKGAHECLDDKDPKHNTGEPKGNPVCTRKTERQDCRPGYRCATWATKKNECVKTCVTNKDCPLAGQKCKKPIGTSFKRCK